MHKMFILNQGVSVQIMDRRERDLSVHLHSRGAEVPAKQAEEQDDTTTEEEGTSTRVKRRMTPSIAAIKQVAIQVKLKEQPTKWKRATVEGLGDLDLEEAMEQMGEGGEKMTTSTATTTTATVVMSAATSVTTASTSRVVVAEVYAKLYTKSAEQRSERSTARTERRENTEKE